MPGELLEQKSLAGYRLCVAESDTTERLNSNNLFENDLPDNLMQSQPSSLLKATSSSENVIEIFISYNDKEGLGASHEAL